MPTEVLPARPVVPKALRSAALPKKRNQNRGPKRAFAGDDLLHALKPVTDATLAKPAGDDWLMRRGNFAAWGYSTLDQVNAQNVGRLKLAWAWNMEPGYQEEAPLAHDGVLFLANPKNVVQALDGRTGDLLWE